FNFHFGRFSWCNFMSLSDGIGNAAAGSDVVFFNQKSIVETDAMVMAAAADNRVFLRAAQAGNGFARIKQLDLSMSHLLCIVLADSGSSREGLYKIQRRAFAGEQAACLT